jgi:hypothetical protein
MPKQIEIAGDANVADAPAVAAKASASVKMMRAVPTRVGAPMTADVHPDEVAAFLAAGWVKEA